MPAKKRAWVTAGVAAAIAVGSLATMSASSQALPAASCSVTPVIPSDVAIGASTSLSGLVSVPIGFDVAGSCTPAQLSGAHWVGDTINTLGSFQFGYLAGNRPEMVQIRIIDFGPYEVTGSPQNGGFPAGLTVNPTTFTLRRGTSLVVSHEVKNTAAGTTTFTLLAQQDREGARTRAGFSAGVGWGPLSGRVYFQVLKSGKWATTKSALLNNRGTATLRVATKVTEQSQTRFIVPGTAPRLLGDGYYAAGREPAIY